MLASIYSQSSRLSRSVTPRRTTSVQTRSWASEAQKKEDHANLETSTTPSGIKVVTYGTSNESALMTSIGVYLKGGSRAETSHTSGFSYFVKELGFRGTESFGDLAVTRILEQFGTQASVVVGREYLGYALDAPRSKIYSLSPALGAQFMSIDLHDHVLRDRKYQAEVSARDALTSPTVRLVELLHQEAFRSQTLGNSIYGTHALVHDHFDPYDHAHPAATEVTSFLENQIKGSGIVVVGTGGVDHATLADHVEELFQGVSKGETSRTKAIYTPGESRTVLNGDSYWGLAFQGVPLGDAHTATAQVLQALLGEARSSTRDGPGWGVTSVLNQKVKGDDVDAMKAFHIPYSDTGLFGIIASVQPNKSAAPSLDRLINELNQLKKGEISAEELTRVKNQAKSHLIDATATPSQVREWLAHNAMSTSGNVQSPAQFLKALDNVTAKDVQTLASKIFTQPALVSLGDAVFPSMEQIRAQLK